MMSKPRDSLEQKVESEYNKLEGNQDKWAVIENLNKLYRVDRILLKYAYQNYPEKRTLEGSKEYKNVQKFYRYILDNILAIEKNYLRDEFAPGDGEIENNYQINRNSTSKFIRDQHEYYNQIFAKYAAKVNEDELGLNGDKIYWFLKQCFHSKYTQVLINGEDYFNPQDSRVPQFEQIIKSYYCHAKEVDESAFVLANVWLEENQILDFLTFWLKENEGQQLYILYCRTEEKLKNDATYLKNQAKNNKKNSHTKKTVHPAKLQVQELQDEIEAERKREDSHELQAVGEMEKKNNGIIKILQKFRKVPSRQQQNPKVQEIKEKLKKHLSKKEQLDGRVSQFFSFGCKRRYILSKNTTFDEIETEGKTMNLQKFINFCNYFGINNLLSRELLTELFKLNALNRLTIDEKRFTTILEALIQTDSKVVSLLLNKKPINTRLRSQAKLSNYKFTLRPINGKLVQNLQTELQLKKEEHAKTRDQRLNQYLFEKLKPKEEPMKKKLKGMSSRMLPDSTNILELENIRDDSFNPSQFFGNDHDDLLSMYESKFQQKNVYSSGLPSVLSKRLEKGSKVVKKVNSSYLKSYE